MRTHGSARRSPAIRSRRCVSSFSCASSALRSASHSSRETTRGLSLAAREGPVVLVVCVLIALAPDRTSVVSGKGVSVGVGLGGRRLVKKNTRNVVYQYTKNSK